MSVRTRSGRRRSPLPAVAVGALSLVAAAALGAAPAVALPGAGPGVGPAPVPGASHRPRAASLPGSVHGAGSFLHGVQRSAAEKVDRSLAGAHGRVDVMIELDAAPSSRAFSAARPRGLGAARAAGRSQAAAVRRAQAAVEGTFRRPATRARTLYRTHALYSGVAVQTDAGRLAALADLPGVKAVHPLTPKVVSNSASVPLIGAPEVWHSTGKTGEGVRVGVIDTGIDYTHADFGGPGTREAFAAAKATDTFTPTAKVVGGYDFAGDAYNPSQGVDTPVPDANPLDCEGHGSHVAGTVAGLGVDTAGHTWSGGYASDINPSSVSIGPGVAPGASLYALKVFGCDGDTNLVGQALDWAADPNQDGDTSDHLDVVNMSLGSSYGSPDDPDSVAANNLAALGTVVVASMGNSGDVYEVGGSPGNATRVIAVAASDDGHDVLDGLKVDAPTGIEPADTVDGTRDDVFAALRSTDYDWTGGPGVTDTPVVTLGDWSRPEAGLLDDATDGTGRNNTDACAVLSPTETTAVVGKVVLTRWYDGTGRRCGSAARSKNLLDAGAAGVVFGSDTNTFSAGVAGLAGIPAMLTVNQATTAIRAALDGGTEVRVTMTNALRNSVTVVSPGAVDQLASFSSRGIGVPGTVKPDVAAPGVTTFSVAVGTGSEGVSESGTSMAAPHVTGQAALVRAVHPTWSTEQVKAAIMDTASQDVFTGPGHTGDAYGPERVGSGRVRVDGSVATTTLAYALDTPGAVGVSFGPVPVTAATTTLRRTVRLVNTRATGTAAYTVGFQPAHATPGVSYTFSPSQVSVPAGGTADVTVTATFTRSALRAVQDPTTQANPLGWCWTETAPCADPVQRSYRTDASGRMVLTPADADTTPLTLRVPVWSAPRPASAMAADPTVVVGGTGPARTGSLALRGSGVDQGGTDPTAYHSLVSAFQLQGSSPRLPACTGAQSSGCVLLADDRSADLRYAGSASDVPTWAPDQVDGNALVSFGLSSWGPWRTPASYTEFDVMLDTNGDHVPDAVVYNTRAVTTDDYDYFLSELVDLRDPNKPVVLDDQFVNATDGAQDTDVFNSDSLVLPVSVGALKAAGLVSGTSARLSWWVESTTAESVVNQAATGGVVDRLGSAAAPFTLSIGTPALSAWGDTYGNYLNGDVPGKTLRVVRNDATQGVDRPKGLLLLHHDNTDGSRAQVVNVRVASSTRLAVNAATYTYGGRPVYTATVNPSTATGTVSFKDGGRVVRTVAVSGGRAVWQASGQTRGRHTMTATYNGDAVATPSTSAPVVVTVRGLASRVTLRTGWSWWRYGSRPPVVTATVSPTAATGTVTFRDGTRVLRTVAVTRGVASYRLPTLARGTHRVTAVYNGSGAYNPATSTAVTLTVR